MGLSDLDQSYLELLHQAINSMDGNETIDFRKPYIKVSLRHVYPLFILLHACVMLFGFFGNMSMFVVIVRGRLYSNPLFFFIANLALSDMIKSGIVLPITLANLLLQNWVFGSFLCFFLPMMHSFPIHATMMTYLMVAIHRYRFIVHPIKSSVPAGLCTIAVWVIAVCIVLPYAVYIKYIDLEQVIGPAFKGLGICFVNLERNVEEYIRAIFVILYCLPLATIAFLYVKVSAELKSFASTNSHAEDTGQNTSEASYHTRITWSMSESDNRIDPEGASSESTPGRHYLERRYSNDQEEEIDLRKEKRTQKYMISMVVLFAMCWCPINILILVTHFIFENDDNSGHFDITYLTFTFFGYMSTCINPVLFASWRMSESTKDRLRGYFRFSNRRQSVLHSNGGRQHEVYAVQQPVPTSIEEHEHNKSYV